MEQLIIPEWFVEEQAAEIPFTKDELNNGIQKIQNAIEPRLNLHFKRCRLESGLNYILLEDTGTVWFAFSKFRLKEETRRSDIEIEPDLLHAVAMAHLEYFQKEEGLSIAFSRSIATNYKADIYYPIKVAFPDGWEFGQDHSYRSFKEFVWRYDMTPAEALDYWAVEESHTDPIDWAGKRDVVPEAVRKNVRQAKEKLNDPDRGATHEVNQFQAVLVEDVPDGKPVDSEKGLFYIPTEESMPDDYGEDTEATGD